VVVGAGYTGTELTAQGALFTAELRRAHPGLRDQRIRWLLLDLAPRVLPELDQRLSATADRVLRRRGVEVLLGTSIVEASTDAVQLTTGAATEKGRLAVDEHLAVPGHPELFACGDAAAVPDPARPGALTAMTAQHATRQDKLAAHNVAAALRGTSPRPYRHRDLGFLVDLGGWQAAANPLGRALSGLPARALTRGYHLATMPAWSARGRCRSIPPPPELPAALPRLD
jgi:NADH dehydrogenase